MQLIKVSPKGQITIPKEVRDSFINNQLLFEAKGKTIILRMVTITYEDPEMEDFSHLGTRSFDFWNDDQDDIYEEFYKSKVPKT